MSETEEINTLLSANTGSCDWSHCDNRSHFSTWHLLRCECGFSNIYNTCFPLAGLEPCLLCLQTDRFWSTSEHNFCNEHLLQWFLFVDSVNQQYVDNFIENE